ncbi:MAG: hypothetical protein JW908_15445 [Anaerolineales bacterium]|nr:hypothetical protein [Anaerolineales bacterium]
MSFGNKTNIVWNKSLIRIVFSYIFALLIGFLAFCYFYPLSYILSDDIGFYTGDSAQHVSGFYAFRDTPWHLPVFWTDRLNYPEGVNIINTDSIPIVALIVKPFIKFLPPDFHYFRLWYLLAFLVQAVGAVFLIHQMGRQRLIDGILAACFAVITPCFVLRSGHTTLMTQGILLIALGFYFKGMQYKNKRIKPPRIWYGLWISLIGISFLMHVYLTAMILPVYWAAVFDMYGKRNSWGTILLDCLYPLVVLIILFFAFWFSPNSVLTTEDSGYGVFSMNLYAPFVGGSLITWGENLLPVSPQQAHEGQNYLGLGVIILFFLAIYFIRNSLKQIWQCHRYFIILLMLFSIFALSNKIYAGTTLLWEYPPFLSELVGFLGNRFRSTGRFFWPVGYAIIFSAIAGVLRLKQKLIPLIVMGLLILQIWDVPKFNFDTIVQVDQTAKEAFPPRLWNRLLSGKEMLYVMPALKCGGRVEEISTLQLLAAKNHVLINTVYGARNTADCEEKQKDMLSHLESGTVHVFLSVVYKNPVSLEQVKQFMGENTYKWCRQFSQGIVCVPDPDERDLNVLNSKLLSKLPKE